MRADLITKTVTMWLMGRSIYNVETVDKAQVHVLSLVRFHHTNQNSLYLKFRNCLFLECPIEYFQTVAGHG